MKTLIHALLALLALLLLAQPAAAGGSYFFGGAAAPANIDAASETCGTIDANGAGYLVTAAGSNNAETTYATIGDICTTTSDWAGFFITFTDNSASTARYLFSLSKDGGSNTAVQELPAEFANQSQLGPIWIPLNVAAGSHIQVKVRGSAANSTVHFSLRGIVRTAASPPLYTTMTRLIAADTTNTRATTVDVAFTNTTSSWTNVGSTTGAAYGAIMASLSNSGFSITPAQACAWAIASGAGPTEITKFTSYCTSGTSGTLGKPAVVINQAFASGTQFAAHVLVPSGGVGSNTARVALWGFN